VFRSVGYRGVELPGVPFDERSGTVPNARGRVEPGVYVAGWIKRGPSGVIGTNKKDATETVELLLEDLRDATRKDRPREEIEALLVERGVRLVLYPGWTSIDELERAAGEKLGRPRVKLCSWDELLEAAETAVTLES
jgi:ferredoxin--NADP+ reductase